MRKTLALISLPLMTLALSSCMTDSADNLPPGHYQHSTAAVDTNGTAYEHSKTTDVGYDANGNKIAVTKTKNSTDPKGLFNKQTTTSTETETEPAE